jgi:PKD repeat protein
VINSAVWDFGDGSPISNERKPVHVYEKPGKYRVLVKVIDIFGNDTSQAFDAEVK